MDTCVGMKTVTVSVGKALQALNVYYNLIVERCCDI